MSRGNIKLLAISLFALVVFTVMLIGAARGGDPRAVWLVCDAMGMTKVCQ